MVSSKVKNSVLPRLDFLQMIIYLAAVKDIQKLHHKMNNSVFDLLTNSETFIFLYPNLDKKLFASRPLKMAISI